MHIYEYINVRFFSNTFTKVGLIWEDYIHSVGFYIIMSEIFFSSMPCDKGQFKTPTYDKDVIETWYHRIYLILAQCSNFFTIKLLTDLAPPCQSNIYNLYKTLRCINIALHSLKVRVTRKRRLVFSNLRSDINNCFRVILSLSQFWRHWHQPVIIAFNLNTAKNTPVNQRNIGTCLFTKLIDLSIVIRPALECFADMEKLPLSVNGLCLYLRPLSRKKTL